MDFRAWKTRLLIAGICILSVTGCAKMEKRDAAPAHTLTLSELESEVARSNDPILKGVLASRLMESGEPQNAIRAITMVQPLLEIENKDALYVMGLAHALGRGTTRDCPAAVDYFTKAVAKNHTEAAYFLAQEYELGNACPKTPRRRPSYT